MQLRHISIPLLTSQAGGDPWAIDGSLQRGRPAQIADLAQAFHDAGRCSADANSTFDEARRRFEASWHGQDGDHPINDSPEVQGAIKSLGTQSEQLPKIGIDLENIAAALAETQRTSAVLISTLETQLEDVDRRLGEAIDQEDGHQLTALQRSVIAQHICGLEHEAIGDTSTILAQVQSIRTHYSDYLQGSLASLQIDGCDPTLIQEIDAPGCPAKAEPETNRRQHQIDSFTRLFGRNPTSSVDWGTAAALDPHSYDPKNGGAPPNIVVGRIQPVPGQGIVRTNLFIPNRTVWNPKLDWPPTHNNIGDNRGFSPTASPEASRVSIYLDYENGIIVARQNPSIDEKTGQIRVGTPAISAVQRSDGAVLLKYSAADPFSPGGEALAKKTVDVNGTLAIEPTTAGPRVGGTVTNFPALEIYNDRPGASTTTITQAWPRITDGNAGPLVGLWWNKWIGDHSLESRFDDQYPALGLLGLPYAGRIPAMTPNGPALIVAPPATYPLGPVDHPPQIGIHDPVVMLRPSPPSN